MCYDYQRFPLILFPTKYWGIFVQPLVEDAPRLVVNKSPELLQHLGRQRYGYKLSNKMLRAVDSDSDSSSLWYVITSKPKHGHLENIQAKRYVTRRFTQKDVDDGSLLFIVDSQGGHFSDSFSFRVEDVRGNMLSDQHFQMSWSHVRFDREEIVACENIGTLEVTVSRSGNLGQSSFVGINIREMSAKKGVDFVASTTKQVQFNPGEARATWQLTILDDGNVEPNKKLRLTLADPVNTILGDNRKLRVVIINAENGECPQYLGMVSKHTSREDITMSSHGASLPASLDNRDQIVLYHKLSSIPLHPGFDNTYLNTEAEKKTARETSSPSSSVDKTSTSPVGKKNNKKGKGGKGNKNKTKKKAKKKRKKGRKNDVPIINSFSTLPVTSPSYLEASRSQTSTAYQVPKKCTVVTKGLLHFDDFNYQLLKCDGKEWQAWSPSSGNDATNMGSCQQDWYEYDGRCYKPMDERLSWDESEDKCVKMFNGHLTSIRSVRQLQWLTEKMSNKGFWIGLNDKVGSGRWQYTNGDPVTMVNWQNIRPRDRRSSHKKNCIVVKKQSKWRNKHCDRFLSRYVCEAFPTKEPVSNRPTRKPRRDHSRRHTRRQRVSQGSQIVDEGFLYFPHS